MVSGPRNSQLTTQTARRKILLAAFLHPCPPPPPPLASYSICFSRYTTDTYFILIFFGFNGALQVQDLIILFSQICVNSFNALKIQFMQSVLIIIYHCKRSNSQYMANTKKLESRRNCTMITR